MLTGRKLALTLAFAGLLLVAFGAGCKGFFVQPTLSTIAINPTAPTVLVNGTQTLTVYGTYSDGTRSLVTSGVGWSSDPTTVATISGTGSAILTGVTSGSATITASAQAISATATATVIGNVSSITGSPAAGSVTVGEVPGQAFSFAATPGPPNFITTGNGGTLTIAPDDGLVTCTVSTDASNNPDEVCTISSLSTTGTVQYQLVMTYPSSSGGVVTSNTVLLNVSQ